VATTLQPRPMPGLRLLERHLVFATIAKRGVS